MRTGIKRLLEDVAGFKVVEKAGAGEETIVLSRQLSPGMGLMDSSMPGIGDLEVTLKLQRFNHEIKILILTARADLFFPQRLLQAGTSGYLTQGASIDAMIRAIKIVHIGQRYIASELATQLAVKQINKTDGSPFNELSERELQVAIMIIKETQVFIIPQQLCRGPKTVNSYRYRTFDKLGIKDDVGLTRFAMQYGLLEENAKVETG